MSPGSKTPGRSWRIIVRCWVRSGRRPRSDVLATPRVIVRLRPHLIRTDPTDRTDGPIEGGCYHRIPDRVPSSRGPGHHPLKVETRVRTPLGLRRDIAGLLD